MIVWVLVSYLVLAFANDVSPVAESPVVHVSSQPSPPCVGFLQCWLASVCRRNESSLRFSMFLDAIHIELYTTDYHSYSRSKYSRAFTLRYNHDYSQVVRVRGHSNCRYQELLAARSTDHLICPRRHWHHVQRCLGCQLGHHQWERWCTSRDKSNHAQYFSSPFVIRRCVCNIGPGGTENVFYMATCCLF